MGLINWYHERRIFKLAEEHGRDIEGVRRSYNLCLSFGPGINCWMNDLDLPIKYKGDVLNSAEESLPERAKRVGVALLDTFLPVC